MKIKALEQHIYAPELNRVILENGKSFPLSKIMKSQYLTYNCIDEVKTSIRRRLKEEPLKYHKLFYDFNADGNILKDQRKNFKTLKEVRDFIKMNTQEFKLYTPEGYKPCKPTMDNIRLSKSI